LLLLLYKTPLSSSR